MENAIALFVIIAGGVDEPEVSLLVERMGQFEGNVREEIIVVGAEE